MLHLSFARDQVEPETLALLVSGELGPGTPGEILTAGRTLKRVAVFELQKVNDLKGFIRLDFRLLSVTPFIRDGVRHDGRRYLCSYRREQSAPQPPEQE